MVSEETGRLRKQERRDERRLVARRRKLIARLRKTALLAAVLAIPGLWAFEYFGPQELAEAEVIETRLWRHYAGDRSSHQHTAATLQIEGLSETTIDRADGYRRGQRIPVWVRRGRFTSWPYFLDLANPDEIELQRRKRQEEAPGSP